MRAGWAVLCDFDGTAVTRDIGDEVAVAFAGFAHWRAEEDRYASGELRFSQLISNMFAPVTASREELQAFARQTAELRPGFERFLEACRDAGAPFVLCSAGLDVYIEAVLERLPRALRRYVELRCNWAEPSPDGLRVHFQQQKGGCGRCGFCKGAAVDELRGRGLRVAVIGDGTADLCAARRADAVFARGRLVEYCRGEGIAFMPFVTFNDVIDRFPV